jgi:putative tryptophan/tyrosine transport system substrate-binding protein
MPHLLPLPNSNTLHCLSKAIRCSTASSDHDIDTAFATLAQQQHVALLVQSDPLFNNRREKLVVLAAQQKVPAMYDRRDFPAAGGLVSYGASAVEQYRQSGIYVGRILKVNLRTSRSLGLDVPDKLLALADEVIE